jgi:hypothetical protein
MRPDSGVGDAERGGDFRNATHLDDRQQHAELGRRQLECADDRLRRRGHGQRRLADEQRRNGGVDNTRPAARA